MPSHLFSPTSTPTREAIFCVAFYLSAFHFLLLKYFLFNYLAPIAKKFFRMKMHDIFEVSSVEVVVLCPPGTKLSVTWGCILSKYVGIARVFRLCVTHQKPQIQTLLTIAWNIILASVYIQQ